MLLDNELLVWLSLIFPFAGTALVPIVARLGQSVRTAFAVIIGFCTAGTVLLLFPEIWVGRAEGLAYTVSWAPSIGFVFSVYIDP